MPPRPLYYTFGNHMHWVDMQWLWGYDVLPGSVRDMLRLCREAGVKGNINFDGIGYEKMAAECPEALAELREAVKSGIVEPVGCTYGQPYGLFQDGESNVRQFTYGVRTALRLLGARPRAFWEEEFYFFPQLPQLLAGAGYSGACLFFQWTWHTPELPKERCSLIAWEGIDGTQVPALPRNDLNVHQWPEDFDGLLDKVGTGEWASGQGRMSGSGSSANPSIVQWLELMPTRDWMCRSDLLLPRLRELKNDTRFEVLPRTLSDLVHDLRATTPQPPVRRYTMDDVWHGMTLGKNLDAHPRAGLSTERWILGAEASSALVGLFGRPYASWDVYPTWEIDEAWRECLAAQHHDNHECEGLCGFVGAASFARASQLASEIVERSVTHLARRASDGPGTRTLVYNPVGFARPLRVFNHEDSAQRTIPLVPPFGYATVDWNEEDTSPSPALVQLEKTDDTIRLWREGIRVTVDASRGLISQIESEDFPDGMLLHPLLALEMNADGQTERFEKVEVETRADDDDARVYIRRSGPLGGSIGIEIALDRDEPIVHVTLNVEQLARPDAGMNRGLKLPLDFAVPAMRLVTDSPFAAHEVDPRGSFKRKYPSGDWMTSPQWFETVDRPFTGLHFVDCVAADGRGVLICHDGAQQFFRTDTGITSLVTCYDPWDEENSRLPAVPEATFAIVPHRAITNAQRVRHALDLGIGPHYASGMGDGDDLPVAFGALEISGAPGVLVHALHRESGKSGEHVPNWAGHLMRERSGGACSHPYVVRLVEWNGEPAEVTLKLPGAVASIARTNILGEVLDDGSAGTGWLRAEPAEPPEWARGARVNGKPVTWSQVRFPMRPREIATIMADLVMGRKEWRDLDAKREVWATVHKETGGAQTLRESKPDKPRRGTPRAGEGPP